MKKFLLLASIVALYIVMAISIAFAQQEIISDKKAIMAQKEEIKEDAAAARQEERQLKDQILVAEQSGDMETAKRLRDQLKAMHKENVGEMRQDKRELKEARHELKKDIKGPHKEGKLHHPRVDKDNNPPGPKGGPGASPDRGRRR